MNKKLLKEFLKSGLTAYALSQMSGIDQTTILRWVRGGGITLATAERIAESLGLTIKINR